jgi:hypothetical protein
MSTGAILENTSTVVTPSAGQTTSGTANPGLVINATYDASVPTEAQTAFNKLIELYENTFSNPIHVNLNITFGDTGLGASETAQVLVPYSVWVGHLNANATSNPGNTFEASAVSNLPASDPLGHGEVTLTTADARALGISQAEVTGDLTPQSDSTITFSSHSDITFEYNQVAAAGRYDFMDVAAHELNEALGIGSALTNLPNNGTAPTDDFAAEDYFRYQTGSTSRDITLSPNANVSFSYDGGKTDVAQFNQDNNFGDRNDWIYGNGSAPPSSPFVQDAREFSGQVAPILTSAGGQTPESTVLSVLGFDEIPCYYEGSLIDTPLGKMPVEALSVGDDVLTADGHPAAVSWIGHRRVSAFFADPLRAYPIRIKANALAENMPSRDLLLSPDHAILVDNLLIQAGALVNDISIFRETNVPEMFTYYHIELDNHRLILAENTPAETFIDNIDRVAFDNWADHEVPCPEGRSPIEMSYPRVKSYRQVPQQIRRRLAARGIALFGGDAEEAA